MVRLPYTEIIYRWQLGCLEISGRVDITIPDGHERPTGVDPEADLVRVVLHQGSIKLTRYSANESGWSREQHAVSELDRCPNGYPGWTVSHLHSVKDSHGLKSARWRGWSTGGHLHGEWQSAVRDYEEVSYA